MVSTSANSPGTNSTTDFEQHECKTRITAGQYKATTIAGGGKQPPLGLTGQGYYTAIQPRFQVLEVRSEDSALASPMDAILADARMNLEHLL